MRSFANLLPQLLEKGGVEVRWGLRDSTGRGSFATSRLIASLLDGRKVEVGDWLDSHRTSGAVGLGRRIEGGCEEGGGIGARGRGSVAVSWPVLAGSMAVGHVAIIAGVQMVGMVRVFSHDQLVKTCIS